MGKDKKDNSAGENIRVAIRVRPLFDRERERGEKECVEVDIPLNQVIVKGEAGAPYTFTFDFVFNKSFSQKDIFLQVTQPMIEATLEGFNSTIFAYGQSGSGKTHTMSGIIEDEVEKGIIPRSFEYIFGKIKDSPSNVTWRLFCSYLELYNGKCRDLLADNQTSLAIREAADKSFFVQDLSIPEVKFMKELYRHMEEGTERRCVGVTDLNAHSSRSHSVFTVHLERTEIGEEGEGAKVVTSKLNLVDLAGSERQSKTNATGDRLKEGANINLSLSALGTVIDSIVKGKGHIPFRSSPLTMLLKDSLGGGSKTAMFANIRPSDTDISETVSTLRFADRAKQIKNKPKIQMDPKDAKIAELMEEIDSLRHRLRKYESGTGSFVEDEESRQNKEMDENMADRLAQLEVDLEEAKGEAERLQTELSQAKASAGKHHEELAEKLARAEESVANLQQEKDLVNQQLVDEQGQHHEVQAMIIDFIKELRLPDVAADSLATGKFEVNQLSKILDTVNERVREGLGGVNKEQAENEIQAAVKDQRKKFEEQEKQRAKRHQEEVERISSLNEQAQAALHQAMNRLVKMKEKIEKEKAKSAELAEQLKKQKDESDSEHKNELQALRTVIADLESQLQKSKTAHVELQLSMGGVHRTDSMRKSLERAAGLNRSESSRGSARGTPSAAGGGGEDEGGSRAEERQAIELEQQLTSAKEKYENSKTNLAAQLRSLEAEREALTARAHAAEGGDGNAGGGISAEAAAKIEEELAAKQAHAEKLKEEMSKLKSQFAKEKQNLVGRINSLKQSKGATEDPRNQEAQNLENQLSDMKSQFDQNKASMVEKMRALEEERALLSKQADSAGGAAGDDLARKEAEFQQLRADYEKMKNQFAKDKQSMVGRINTLKKEVQGDRPPKPPGRSTATTGTQDEGVGENDEEAPTDDGDEGPEESGGDSGAGSGKDGTGKSSGKPRREKARSSGRSGKSEKSGASSKAKGGEDTVAAAAPGRYTSPILDAAAAGEVDADELTLEIQRLGNELERVQREHQVALQEREEGERKMEQQRKDLERARQDWVEEKRDMEAEMENIRGDLMAEVQKSSKLNQEQIAMCRKVEEIQALLQQREREKDRLAEQLEELKKAALSQEEQVKNHQQIENQLKEKHAREIQRLEAKLNEKAITLENNRKVLQTQQYLLDKKKQKEAELEEKVKQQQDQIKEMEENLRQQLAEQAEKMTQYNNKKIEELVNKHRQQLHNEQKEREKIAKKVIKERMKVDKVRERYDQTLVLVREMEQQIETMKVSEIKRFQQNANDEVQMQRAEIDQLLRGKDLSDRQQALLKQKAGKGDESARRYDDPFSAFSGTSDEGGPGLGPTTERTKNKASERAREARERAERFDSEGGFKPVGPAGFHSPTGEEDMADPLQKKKAKATKRQKEILERTKVSNYTENEPVGPKAILGGANARAQRMLGGGNAPPSDDRWGDGGNSSGGGL